MTVFEFIFSLISVITSLALTRLLNGCIGLYRHAGPVRWSWRHGLWTASAFMLLIGNWASFWRRSHNVTTWGAFDVLLQLTFSASFTFIAIWSCRTSRSPVKPWTCASSMNGSAGATCSP